MKDFNINFCLADSEYMTAVRLAVGAFCATADEDVDKIEDMKVCVTESCIILKDCGFERAQITLLRGDDVTCEVCGLGGTPSDCDNDFSLALISALVTACNIERNDGVINKLLLTL